MNLPDVNVLIQSFRKDLSDHVSCFAWLEGLLNGEARFGVSTQVLSALIRTVTNSKIFARPSGLEESIDFCNVILESPNSVFIQPGDRHWEIFTRLCVASDARGNLVPDAWFAALAIESGCEWITLDRDFARFPGLRWRPPS